MEMMEFTSADKTTVIIQINPQEAKDSAIYVDGLEDGELNHNAALKGFFKAEPKALGTVQIMTGVMVFLLGIVLTNLSYSFHMMSVYGFITYWGSAIYISTGSLSVAAQNQFHLCVLKASLGMNLFSIITAETAIILASMDLSRVSLYNCCYDDKRSCLGITGILLVLSILQLIISIAILVFACKVACKPESTVVNVSLNQGY
ncbi:membrane-spanning 4-domains subfamily A member 4A-like [Puntigrus tetrazona]|uniref:membrane-spanning 4-domains subfamily A member 4A-like n=1 Tax=Puntigrus tetrazona TaxID=1606681 RepID=UPI001C899DD1|nr:membrane-spanning 4-domains subfamily A member 4A-like [Puntigrus tetrazona]